MAEKEKVRNEKMKEQMKYIFRKGETNERKERLSSKNKH